MYIKKRVYIIEGYVCFNYVTIINYAYVVSDIINISVFSNIK